ncbi:MAG TPA: hypothetical protein VGH86_11090 [Phenylobacterium sp.]|jgi:hypothetical protein
MVNVKLPGKPGGGVPVLDAELAAGPVAVGVHRGLGHAEFARDLLGRQVLIDQSKAFTLARREQSDRVLCDDVPGAHGATSKRRLEPYVYFKAKVG